MTEFKIGQRIRVSVICKDYALNGYVGTIVDIGKSLGARAKLYYVILDEYKSGGKLAFHNEHLELIDAPGRCNKCASIIPKDRTVCCSCKDG